MPSCRSLVLGMRAGARDEQAPPRLGHSTGALAELSRGTPSERMGLAPAGWVRTGTKQRNRNSGYLCAAAQ